MSPQSAEYHVARTYLEVFATLPWNRTSDDRLDLKAARDILDRDHYDLKTVKERILEYLAVRTLNRAARGSIMCFVGPPGEAHDAAARRTVERAHGEILEDPLLDGLEIVVIAIEDVARGLQVEPVVGGAVPRQGREHLQVGARDMVLGRLGRHLPQPLQLALDHLGGFLV